MKPNEVFFMSLNSQDNTDEKFNNLDFPTRIVYTVENSDENIIYVLTEFVKFLAAKRLNAQVRVIIHYCSDTAEYTALGAFCKTVNLEHSRIFFKTVQMDKDMDIADILDEEFKSKDVEVVYKDGKRFVKILEEVALPDENSENSLVGSYLKNGEVYLITGGLGGLGFIFSKYFAENYNAKLVLTGRSDVDNDKIKQIEDAGAEVLYVKADITSKEDTKKLINLAKQRFGKINGVLHCAGVIKDSLIIKKDKKDMECVIGPKIQGTRNLDEFIRNEDIDIFVLFSSAVGITGNLGQCDYAYANSFMDEFTRLNKDNYKKIVSINWPLWENGGMKVNQESKEFLMDFFKSNIIDVDTGISAFEAVVKSNFNQLFVADALGSKELRSKNGREDEKKSENLDLDTNNSRYASKTVTKGKCKMENRINIKQGICRIACKILNIQENDIDTAAEFAEYGFDSITFGELANEINKIYKLNLMPTIFFEYSSVDTFIEYLKTEFNVDDDECSKASISSQDNCYSHTGNGKNKLIAITGMAGVFPKSPNLNVFWENLKNGVDMIDEIPRERWIPQEDDIKYGGFIEDVDKFDCLFFGISPKEAELMDPQQRILLETVWKAIEDAGYKASDLAGTKTGMFIGAVFFDYSEILKENGVEVDAQTATGNLHSIISNRISYLLDLTGPSETIDTACSSSLVSIHNAVKAICDEDCDMAIAGGVNLILTPTYYESFKKAGMLSADGKCKTFDKSANGYARGEGAGVILLKPLEKAITDGDHIYAVIKGTAVNHCGHTNSLTAPDPNSQSNLIVNAWADTGLLPTYIEAHGTGTSLGDPIEINGLKKAFKHMGMPERCGIGTVKTNIGHLEGAAGVAGVIKVLLSMKYGEIPQNLHFKELNPYIKLNDTTFYIVDRLTKWEGNRVAGVSSFGFGGVNAHIVLQQYISNDIVTDIKSYQGECDIKLDNEELHSIILSAKAEDRLKEYAQNLIKFLEDNDNISLAELSYTLQVGREAMDERLGFLAYSIDDTIEKLKEYVNSNLETVHVGTADKSRVKLMEGKTGQEILKIFIDRKELAELTELWVSGIDVEWKSLYKGRKIQRISIPAYPFAKERYWIPENSNVKGKANDGKFQKTAWLHPLIDANESTFEEQKFRKVLKKEEFFLKDHVIKDNIILPGVAYLETARVAGALSSSNNKVIKIRDVVWLSPIILADEQKDMYINLYFSDTEEVEFEISTDSYADNNERSINAQGKIIYGDSDELSGVEKINIEEVKSRCNRHKTHDEFYTSFREDRQVMLGDSFKSVQGVYSNKEEALSHLVLPESLKSNFDEFLLHPSIVDGSVQTIISEIAASNQGSTYIPFTLGEIEILKPIEKECYAYGKLVSESGIKKIDIKITDTDGQVLVAMKNFSVGEVKDAEENRLEDKTDCEEQMKKDVGEVESELDNRKDNEIGSNESGVQQPQTLQSDGLFNMVQNGLISSVCEILKIEKTRVKLKADMISFGFDSILFTKFSNDLNKKYGIRLMPSIFFEYKTLHSFIEYLVEEYKDKMAEYYKYDEKANESIKISKIQEQKVSEPNRDKGAIKNDVPMKEGIKTKRVVKSKENTRKDEHIECSDLKDDPIAIVGVAGIMPKSPDLDALWENLIEGRNLITEIPKDRWDWEEYYGDPKKEVNKTNIKWGGFVDEIDKFDPLFFGISPREAELMDPQQRKFLEVVWKAIEDAGYKASDLSGTKTGIFVGVGTMDYVELLGQANAEVQGYTAIGMFHSIVPNRISYILNLHGPSEPIDTACSSALSAIHEAVKAIQCGDCDLAIAGGTAALLAPSVYISFSKAGMLSSDGKCKTFDKDADGYARGEGCGAIILKPLSKAIKDKDNIYAVIKGSAVAHGGHAASLTAPDPAAQAELIVSAWEKAGVDPETITYIEAHGTGTPLGDPIEVNGLKKAFNELYKMWGKNVVKPHCGVGTIKTNMGHLEAAAGIAGIIKVLLSMKNKKIPRNINFNELNQYIELEDTPLYIVKENTDWITDGFPRRAGVSSFGFGGAYAHIALEEYTMPVEFNDENNRQYVIILSAKDKEGLNTYAENMIRFIDLHKDISLNDLAYTLQVGREAMDERIALIVSNLEELREKLVEQKNVYRGSVKEEHETSAIVAGVEGEHFVQEIITNKNYELLCNLWVTGANIDWRLLYGKQVPKRISLPTYPFAKQRYWVPAIESILPGNDTKHYARLHPLIDINRSTLEKQSFKKTLEKTEFFIEHHVVAGFPMFPGSGYLEMAIAAGDLSDESSTICQISDVVWANPIVVEDKQDVCINLYPEEANTVAFEITTGKDKLHANGKIVYGTVQRQLQVIDIPGIKSNCTKRLDKEEVYDKFYNRGEGILYGSSFRSIEYILKSENEVLAYVELQDIIEESFDQFMLHPSIIDAAFQAVEGFFDSDMNVTYVPFALEELEILGDLERVCYAHVTKSGYANKFNIKIVNETGKVLVAIKGFTVSQYKANRVDQDNSVIYLENVREKLNIRVESEEEGEKLSLEFVDEAEKSELLKKTRIYLREVFSQTTKIPVQKIQLNEPLEKYGIDSVMILTLTLSLEKIFGEISKTLFFEYTTLEGLAEYFVNNYQDVLMQQFKMLDRNYVQPIQSQTQKSKIRRFMTQYPQKASYTQEQNYRQDDIAIIGMSGRYPMANDLAEYWENLKEGKDCITEIPNERWDYNSSYNPDKNNKGTSYSKWGGFIEDVDKFDPFFFNISPREAELMDPQGRIFLEAVWHALEDGGYTRDRLSKSDVGVFVGIMYGEYQLYGAEETMKGYPIATNSSYASIANRVSYYLNLHGPSMAIDTMCSSSLTAIHLACESMRMGEIDLAIAGGVNVSIHPNKYLFLSQGKFLASDGRCKSFGEGGDGYVPGEGVGAVVLKPLRKATEDGDIIYGVIKASSLNHGGKTNGFTVPNPNAQEAVIAKTLQKSNIDPRSISYIEAHGTGTSLGDPIEIVGLSKAFEKYTNDKQFCAIGSAKSNIGHLESAAGIAGITKVLLQMKYKQLVPSIYSSTLNPNIDFNNTPFYVQHELTDWKQPELSGKKIPRIAGVSSFGAGGSNAHIILEEYIPTLSEPSTEVKEPQVIVLSAKSKERLNAYIENMIMFLDCNDNISLEDFSYTLQVGREAMEERLALVVSTMKELKQRLVKKENLYTGSISENRKDDILIADEDEKRFIRDIVENKMLDKICELWVAGIDIDWSLMYKDRSMKRISLPTYPFERKRYWFNSFLNEEGFIQKRRNIIMKTVYDEMREDIINFQSDEVTLDIIDNDIALISMQDKESKNTFTSNLVKGLMSKFYEVCNNSSIKAVIVTGYDNVFCMGGTQEELIDLSNSKGKFTDLDFIYRGILECRVPVISAIQGHAVGGGLAFGLYGDIIIMAKDCIYSANFMKYGFTPGLGATFILKEKLGNNLAMEMMFTADQLEGSELKEKGAGITFKEQHEVLKEAFRIAKRLADKPVNSLKILKRNLSERILKQLLEVIESEVSMHDKTIVSKESKELIEKKYFSSARKENNTTGSNDVKVLLKAKANIEDSKIIDEARIEGEVKIGNEVRIKDIEKKVTEIIDARLHVNGSKTISIDADFKDLGVDSIFSVEIIKDVNDKFEINLDAIAIYDYPTINSMSKHIFEAIKKEKRVFKEATIKNTIDPIIIDKSNTDQSDTISDTKTGKISLSNKLKPKNTKAEASNQDSKDGYNSVSQLSNAENLFLNKKIALDSPNNIPELITDINKNCSYAKNSNDIAIIGISCRFPGAKNKDEFWENLVSGKDSIIKVPKDRWDADEYYDADMSVTNKINSKWGGFLTDIDKFDPLFFNISPKEAEFMDPQQRVFLEEAWKAFEDAGYSRDTLSGVKCGAFVGTSTGGDYINRMKQVGKDHEVGVFTGISSSILASRISYFLNLKGPSVAIDTACSSSLVATHLACQSILNNESEMALAGGVMIIAGPDLYINTSNIGMLSPTGKCRTFDDDADGTVFSEGVGVVILKSLDKAIKDNDNIYAVIKGSGINQDGKTNGITAPSAKSQTDLELEVYNKVNINPEQIGYVEAHGTGTKLGDPIEVKALSDAFKSYTDKKQFCAIGSVKTNIGHAVMASGISSLIKTTLALKYKKIPPSLNFNKANEHIDFENSPFYVNANFKKWDIKEGVKRIAAVSSFGFSGTNCHIVLEEYDNNDTCEDEKLINDSQIVVLSARNKDRLNEYMKNMIDFLDANSSVPLVDLAYTLQVGREAMEERLALIASTLGELKEKLIRQKDLYTGSIENDKGPGLLVEGEEGGKFLKDVIEDKALDKICELWITGVEIDWSLMYEGRCPKKISLPTYPFKKQKYWITSPDHILYSDNMCYHTRLHPLLDCNESTIDKQCFKKELNKGEFFLKDHIINNQAVFPGAAYLEMVRAAGSLSDKNNTVLAIKNVMWLNPIVVEDKKDVYVNLYPDSDNTLEFEVVNNESMLHASGKIEYTSKTKQGSEVIDISALKDILTEKISNEEIHEWLKSAGISCGASFRNTEYILKGEREVLSYMRLDDSVEDSFSEFLLHPGLIDNAFQSVIGFWNNEVRNTRVPFALEEIKILSNLEKRCYVYAVKDNDDANKFNIKIMNESGEVLVVIRGLIFDGFKSRVRSSNAVTYYENNEADLISKVQAQVLNIAAEVVNIKQSELSITENISKYGFDSILFTQFSKKLNELYNLMIMPSIFFEYPSVDTLCEYLINEHKDVLVSYYGEEVKHTEKSTLPIIHHNEIAKTSKKKFVNTKNEGSSKVFQNKDMAIVGMAGIMPNSFDLDSFWDNLVNGIDMISTIPEDRFKTDKPFYGGFMPDVDKFDAQFFEISPMEAELMDPQQRIFMEVVWEMLEDAGYAPSSLAGTKTGLFVGVATNDYNEILIRDGIEVRAHTSTGSAHSILANRISYLLDIHGPSEPIDTACSSSLVAIHRAVHAIQDGECDMAIAGGVNVLLTEELFESFSDAGMLSIDGRCKTFDKSANGYVRGEGAGAIFIKSLSRAIEDGDHIYAVIKGTAVNHGGRANSLTAPNPKKQAELIINAWKEVGKLPTYIEAHGTGTSLGDPIEINGIKKAFKELGMPQKCAIGAVKSNIGHLETAAGIAGVIKVLLAMKYGKIPGNLHFSELNPQIQIEDTPFYIANETTDWEGEKIAGVSSFGFGGANAHVVLEQYIPTDNVGPVSIPQMVEERIIVLSAKNKERLDEYVRNMIDFLDKNEVLDINNFAYTLQVGRVPMEERLALVVSTLEELKERLIKQENLYYGSIMENRKPGLLIDGQEGERFIRDVVENKRLNKICELWVAGINIDWSLMYQGRSIKRISLPTYPFLKQRYWIPKQGHILHSYDQHCSRLHRLIDSNESTIYEQCFKKELDKEEFFLKDHILNNELVLPGAAYLEMARVAGSLSDRNNTVLVMKDVMWVNPIVVEEKKNVYVNLYPKTDSILEFAVVTDKDILHASGEIEYTSATKQESEFIDIPTLKDTFTEKIIKEELYELFKSAGLSYGISFKNIEYISKSEKELLSFVKLNDCLKNGFNEFVLHPSVVDAAFQSAAGLVDAKMGSMYVPFALEEIRIVSDLEQKCYIHVIKDNYNPNKYNIKIVSESGKVLVVMKGFTIAEYKSEAKYRNEVAYYEAKRVKSEISDLNAELNETGIFIDKDKADLDLIGKLQPELLRIAAGILKIEQSELDVSVNISEYGFDSILFTQFSKILNEEYNISIMPSIFFEYPSIGTFCEYLACEYKDVFASYYRGKVNSEVKVTLPIIQDKDISKTNKKRFINTKNKGSCKTCQNEDMAIVGMAGIMPNSIDLDSFWANLVNGTDMISPVPEDRFKTDKSFYGGFMPNIDKFDAQFFGISPMEAELMDPQQRIFIEVVWKALEDAGYSPSALAGTKTGLFVGVASTDYHELLTRNGIEVKAQTATGGAHSILANRISYLLDIHGPSEPIDTACSSSLVAIHRAVQAIQCGECDMAIAGGVNVMLTDTLFESFSEAGMLSPDGRCKTFDKSANGYVRGEGTGAIFIKPISKAIEDGDHIYAVVRGTAINHGGHANSLTAPNPNAQAELIINAWKNIGKLPTYIEAHGTGTSLGDPIELNGIKKAFHELGLPEKCAIGAVKSNIGHLETAAGIAGVIKVLLSMKHGKIPGNLNFKELNPQILIEGTPFYIAKETTDWEGDRIAGISSFGFGGVNAHVVLEQYASAIDIEAGVAQNVEPQIIVLSAKNKDRLNEYIKNIVEFLNKYNNINLNDLAYTLQIGRKPMEARLAVVASNIDELKEKLTNSQNTHIDNIKVDNGKLLLIEGEEGEVFLKTIISKKKLDKICELWVWGIDMDWELLHKEHNPKRISLPTYPFDNQRYWIPEQKNKMMISKEFYKPTKPIHPLIDISESTLDEYCFKKMFREGEFFLKDHVINNENILPGAAYIEMARVVGSLSNINRKVCSIKNIIWAKPLIVYNQQDTYVELSNVKEDEVDFKVATKELGIHASGKISYVTQKKPITQFIDISAVKNNCTKEISKQEIYDRFSEVGISYGRSFRSIESLFYSENEVLACVRLQEDADNSLSASFDEFLLHPCLIDAAFQSVAGFMSDKDAEASVPFMLDEVIIVDKLYKVCYVYVVKNKNRFDIKVLNEEGQVKVIMKGFLVNKLPRLDHISDKDNFTQNEELAAEANSRNNVNYSTESIEKDLIKSFSEILKIKEQDIDPEAGFDEYGVDSIIMIKILSAIEAMYDKTLDISAISENNTVRKLAEYLLNNLDGCKEIEYDKNFLNKEDKRQSIIEDKDFLYSECVLDEDIVPASYSNKSIGNCKNIFLTGATGFLGAYLIRDFMDKTKLKIYCLVRADNESSAMERIKTNMEFYQCWDECYKDRLVPVLGDLSKPLLGIEEKYFEHLSEIIDILFHNGAVLNFIYGYNYLKNINVNGTIECLKFACKNNPKYFNYVSSYSVFDNPSYFRKTAYENDSLELPYGYFVGYSETKWVAEKLIQIAQQRGLQTIIYRPSEIAGSAKTGIWKMSDFMSRFIVSIIQMGLVPDNDVNLNLTPVDYVSSAMVNISLKDQSIGKAFHLVNKNIIKVKNLKKYFSDYGYKDMQLIPHEEWKQKLLQSDETNALKLLEMLFLKERSEEETIQRRYADLQAIYDTTNTIRALSDTNIKCSPLNKKLIFKYLDFFVKSQYILSPNESKILV